MASYPIYRPDARGIASPLRTILRWPISSCWMASGRQAPSLKFPPRLASAHFPSQPSRPLHAEPCAGGGQSLQEELDFLALFVSYTGDAFLYYGWILDSHHGLLLSR